MAQVPSAFKQGDAVVMVDYTPPAGSPVRAGEAVLQGTLLGIALRDIAAGDKGALCVLGIFRVPKDNSNLTAVGTALYWDADGNPYGVAGAIGYGAFSSTPTANTFAGWCLEIAGATTGTVKALILSSFAVSVTTTDALTDVGTVDYTAGDLLVADGTKFECVPVSNDATLAANGALTLNAAHAEQIVVVRIEDLAAGADIAARPIFVHPRAFTLTSLGILTEGAPAGVDDGNTCVLTLTDDAANEIVAKTYDTSNQPPTSDYADLGALSGTHKVLAAGEHLLFSATQGANSNMPAFSIILRGVPTNA